MKRTLIALAVIFVVLSFAITWLKQNDGPEHVTEGKEASARRERIRSFWDYFGAATTARTHGEFEEAANVYQKALALDPRHEESLFYLAACLQELGKYPEAVEVLRRLTDTHPTSNRGLSQLSVLLTTLAPGAEPDYDAASEALARSKQINYEETGPFIREGLLEINRGELDKARDILSAPAQAGAPEGLFLAGFADYLRNNDASATKLFLRVLEARAHEKAVSGRGVKSEGDVTTDRGDRVLTPLERASIKSQVFLYWIASRAGGYPHDVPDSRRIEIRPPGGGQGSFAIESLPGDPTGRGVWIDVDRDNRPELLVAQEERVRLFRQTLNGWEDATQSVGLSGVGGAWDACAADVDGDDWQDLYLVRKGFMGTGANALLRNESGRFREVTSEVGLEGERATARALAIDLTGDGEIDLLEVGNEGPVHPAVRLYTRNGARFEERSSEMGLRYSGNAVDTAAADVDGNGRADIFVLGWKTPGLLYLNTERGFVDRTRELGLENVGGDGYSALFFDFDRDGWQDLLVTAHAPLELSLSRMLGSPFSHRYTPRLFRNQKGRFEEVTAPAGLDYNYGVMQAVSSDFDGDGWPDLAFAHGGLGRQHLEPSLILRNERGQRFVEWRYIPSVDRPLNALGAAARDHAFFLSGLGVVRYQGF